MTEQPSSAVALAPEKVAALLASALRARRNGNLSAARALLRVLAAEQPSLPQIWLALATVAETRMEQRHALERVAALDPTNPLAQRGLARMRAVPPVSPLVQLAQPPVDTGSSKSQSQPAAVRPVPADSSAGHRDRVSPGATQAQAEPGVWFAPALTPTVSPGEAAARPIRWPLYLVIAISILAVLAATLLIRDGNASAPGAAPTPALPGSAAGPTPALAGAATVIGALTQPAVAVATPLPARSGTATPAPSPALPTVARPTLGPSATPRPTLAIGEVVKQGAWHAVLLRPDYAVPLDGSIDTFQPSGRFILALVAVGNDGPAAAPVPIDMFALFDQAGTRYAPLPAVSTAYLNAYGRGQRGDLSMEDPIPADGGNKSVPLIFDVPESARGLYLVIKDSVAGWPIRQ